MNVRPAMLRLRGHVHNLVKRAGYNIVPTTLPEFLGNPFPIEQAAHRIVQSHIIASRGINCVIDVGANNGGYGRQLRHAGYTGEIVSFEPVERTFQELSAGAAADPRWQTHQLALGSTPGTAPLQIARESNFSTFLRPNQFSLDWYAGSAVDYVEEVEVQRLDAIFDEVTAHVPAPRRVLLKTDTQGFDLEVIKGAEGCLDQVTALQVELSVRAINDGAPDWLEALATLAELGFRPAHVSTVSRDAELAVVEFDCLMVR